MDLNFHLGLGLLIRLLLIAFGYLQDKFFEVKYTDVDYQVFTDAAEYMSKGLSPFQRPTYRYTPLLAFLVLPNVLVHEAFGKVLFCSLDVLTSAIIYRLQKADGHDTHSAKLSCFLWLYNPLPLVISTRGNADSLLALLTTLLPLLVRRGWPKALGLVYGLSVHVKIYPAIYALSLYAAVEGTDRGSSRIKRMLLPTRRRLLFLFFSFIGFALPTLLCYGLYGEGYLQEAMLYHLKRKDTRHNFSSYFYLLYLMEGQVDTAAYLSLLPFLVQAALIAVTSLTVDRLTSAMFIQTLIFVTFNKVVTSQYFIWYLCLFPMSFPLLNAKSLIVPALAWAVTQGSWLLAAYSLEFRGCNTFPLVFAAGMAFLLANVWLICGFIKSLTVTQQTEGKKVE